MQINDSVTFLIIGGDNSVLCDLEQKLADFTAQQNCALNICCNESKVADFIQQLQKNNVKVANNCIIIDDSLETEQLQLLILALKNSKVFFSLPIVVFASENNDGIIDFGYQHQVSAVITKPDNKDALINTIKETLYFWTGIAKLPPFAVVKKETQMF